MIHMAVYLVHFLHAKCDKILFNVYLVVREFNLKFQCIQFERSMYTI